MSRIHIIAEAGNNHNGKFETAKELIDVANNAKADSVKFQIIYPEGLYLPKLYQNGGYVDNEVYQKRLEFMLSDDEYRELAKYCMHKGIGFSASVFDIRGLRLLDDIDVGYLKIASCDLNNYPFLKSVAETGRQVVLSTGMASLGEIEKAVQTITKAGNENIILLHCVSVYPCKTEQMNLPFLATLKTAFGLPVGLSDHTEESIAAVAATAFGITWLEKHFTLDRSQVGFDHAYAMEPDSLVSYVNDIRKAEAACQTGNEKLLSAERTVKERARRSLYAARDITAGEVVTLDDILIVRPEGPMAPGDVDLILGKPTTRQISKYEAIKLSCFNV